MMKTRMRILCSVLVLAYATQATAASVGTFQVSPATGNSSLLVTTETLIDSSSLTALPSQEADSMTSTEIQSQQVSLPYGFELVSSAEGDELKAGFWPIFILLVGALKIVKLATGTEQACQAAGKAQNALCKVLYPTQNNAVTIFKTACVGGGGVFTHRQRGHLKDSCSKFVNGSKTL
jgi:hypothetical protein